MNFAILFSRFLGRRFPVTVMGFSRNLGQSRIARGAAAVATRARQPLAGLTLSPPGHYLLKACCEVYIVLSFMFCSFASRDDTCSPELAFYLIVYGVCNLITGARIVLGNILSFFLQQRATSEGLFSGKVSWWPCVYATQPQR